MWDDEDFEPAPFDGGKSVSTDRWDGEDEEDDVKDSWDADSDEDKASSPVDDDDDDDKDKPKAKQVKKKKKLDQILREKEERKKQEAEELKKAKERLKELTAEEKAAEKARIKKEQEEADLLLARQVFGLDEIDESESVDKLIPLEASDFAALKDALVKKFKKCENSPHYCAFLDHLIKNLCGRMDLDQVRKISGGLAALETEKRKEAKKTKNRAKSKKAPTVKIGKETDELDGGLYDAYDELDDFM